MKLSIKVKARAKQENVKETGDNSLEVWVRELAQKGQANQAVIKAIAKHLKITQNKVKILRGQTSSCKVVAIDSAISWLNGFC
jgi:uncharacterized protein YggU (UPF0235/DUF167 family)